MFGALAPEVFAQVFAESELGPRARESRVLFGASFAAFAVTVDAQVQGGVVGRVHLPPCEGREECLEVGGFAPFLIRYGRPAFSSMLCRARCSAASRSSTVVRFTGGILRSLSFRCVVERKLAVYAGARITASSVSALSRVAFSLNPRGGPASPQYIRRLVRQLGENAALTRRVTPHMFRHSVATYLLEEGVDIRYVQRLLQNRSIGTTEIYTHVADAALKSRVIERHPRKAILRQT